MPTSSENTAAQLTAPDSLPETDSAPLRKRATGWAAQTGKQLWQTAYRTVTIPSGFVPAAKLLAHNEPIGEAQLSDAIDAIFHQLYDHPVTRGAGKLTRSLRESNLLPNESSTEDLIRFVVNQCVERSPVPVPEPVLKEFWNLFDELLSAPELKGMAELSLDVIRYVLKTYEPLIAELVNLLKETRRINEEKIGQLTSRAGVLAEDTAIIRRQIKALRHIKPFFETDPKDFHSQAQIVAAMVREFGPFFIKMAQVAASNTEFLPEEIAKELAVFQEDVDPMTRDDVLEAFRESFGRDPRDLYFGFDLDKPIKSGSIGSVYVARRPVIVDGEEHLKRVVIKVGRHNLDREFQMGKMVLGLAIISSQYWAPHSKLTPFLRAMQEQVDEFVQGFQRELNFVDEARNQQRFVNHARQSSVWAVPRVYRATDRIIEMEYLEDALALPQAMAALPLPKRASFQRRTARRLIYSVILQAFKHREFHGDLHPGNIMIGSDETLWLIDWGNTVDLDGKWGPVRRYVAGALLADVDLLTDALINLSTAPAENRERYPEIRTRLAETLAKKQIAPLDKKALRTLLRGGMEGLHGRLQAVMQLMSNTQPLGIVIRGEYLHLSRSLSALTGSWSSLYEGLPKWWMVMDLFTTAGFYPAHRLRDESEVRRLRWSGQLKAALPELRFKPNTPSLESTISSRH